MTQDDRGGSSSWLDRAASHLDLRADGASQHPNHRGDEAERPDAAMLAALLDYLDTGAIACTEDGRVIYANDSARRELNRGRPLGVDASCRLVPTLATTGMLQWRSTLLGAMRGGRHQMVALGEGEDRLVVSVLPLASTGRACAAVLLGRRRLAPTLAVDMLGRLCNLTVAERQVLGRVLDGARIEDVARARGVKISTLRSQIGALRTKLGADRLEGLTRIVAALPPIAGVLRCPALRGEQQQPMQRSTLAA